MLLFSGQVFTTAMQGTRQKYMVKKRDRLRYVAIFLRKFITTCIIQCIMSTNILVINNIIQPLQYASLVIFARPDEAVYQLITNK